MLGPLARISNNAGKNYMKNFVRNGSHGGTPGETLPFNIHHRARLTFNLFWYVGSGLAAPFILLAFQMKKK